VLIRVQLRRFFVMLGGMQVMTVSDLGMVRGLFVIAGFVVLGGFTVVLCCMLVVIGSVLVVFVDLVAFHRFAPWLLRCEAGALPGIDEAFATDICQFTPPGPGELRTA
jgi:hypothetical protein